MRLRPIASILLFAAVTFPLMIGISQLLADLIGAGPEQTLVPAALWITAVAGWIKHVWNQTDTERSDPEDGDDNETDDTSADTTADSPGPDVEPQSRSYSLGHDPETTDSDSDTDDDSHSNSERSDTDTGRQSSLRRSNTDILDETETRLDDHITFYENGTIRLDNYDDLNMYSRMMLYVIAKRLAYEDQCVDTPQVAGADSATGSTTRRSISCSSFTGLATASPLPVGSAAEPTTSRTAKSMSSRSRSTSNRS